MINKICSKCKRDLPLEFFNWKYKDRGIKESQCKHCKNIYKAEYRIRNKEKIREYFKNHRDNTYHARIKKEKGLNIEYRSLHQYIKKHKPKPKYCIICNEKKKLQLASINHVYTRNNKDWLWLCQSCHILFDKLNEVKIVEHT